MKTENRKSPRLKDYDYKTSALFFVTICTRERICFFGTVYITEDNGEMRLNRYGELLERHIKELDERYTYARVLNHVIMPNHLHMIIGLDNGCGVPLTQIIGLFKSGFSREAGISVWQRSFYDHVIRNEADYKRIWDYIETNPAKWAFDKYYC